LSFFFVVFFFTHCQFVYFLLKDVYSGLLLIFNLFTILLYSCLSFLKFSGMKPLSDV
jgi:hypothetical protein